MLLFNFEIFESTRFHKTFKTLIIYEFPFAMGHKLFKSTKRQPSFVSLTVFLMVMIFCIKRVTNYGKFTGNTSARISF